MRVSELEYESVYSPFLLFFHVPGAIRTATELSLNVEYLKERDRSDHSEIVFWSRS